MSDFLKGSDLIESQRSAFAYLRPKSIIGDDGSVDLIKQPPVIPGAPGLSIRNLLAGVIARHFMIKRLGTAFRIGPRHWLTSAHTLAHFGDSFFASEVEIVPDMSVPYGFEPGYKVRFVCHPNWKTIKDVGYDLAVLETTSPPSLPDKWFRLAAAPAGSLRHKRINIPGYRAGPHGFVAARWHAETVTEDAPHILSHVNDTLAGQSGAPAILWPPADVGTDDLTVVGVHSRGVNDPVAVGETNTATRLEPDTLQWVIDQIAG